MARWARHFRNWRGHASVAKEGTDDCRLDKKLTRDHRIQYEITIAGLASSSRPSIESGSRAPSLSVPTVCSAFVTGLTFWRCELESVKNSLQLRGVCGSERLPALRR